MFSEKASAIARMRQKCVRNASKWVLFYWEKRNVQNASEMRQKCIKTPLGENTFWTIPSFMLINLKRVNGRGRFEGWDCWRGHSKPSRTQVAFCAGRVGVQTLRVHVHGVEAIHLVWITSCSVACRKLTTPILPFDLGSLYRVSLSPKVPP